MIVTQRSYVSSLFSVGDSYSVPWCVLILFTLRIVVQAYSSLLKDICVFHTWINQIKCYETKRKYLHDKSRFDWWMNKYCYYPDTQILAEFHPASLSEGWPCATHFVLHIHKYITLLRASNTLCEFFSATFVVFSLLYTCQVTLDISESPIDFQWGSRKYSG